MKKHSKLILASFLFASTLGTTSVFADTHTVKSGDTLWGISNKYSVSVTDLKSENNLTTNTISVGQELYIPGTPKGDVTTYVVKPGDTLWKISSSFGVNYQEVMKWNNLSSTAIYVGQELKVSASTISPVSPPEPTPSETSVYTVKSGDTLYGVAAKFNLSVSELKAMNALTSNTIFVGQQLKVTGVQTFAFIRPAEGTVTSGFGPRSGGYHYGVDIAKSGTVSVVSAADGVVSRSYVSSSYGEVVFVQHTINGKTYETVYAHLRSGSRAVQVGDTVKQGQHIGYMGNTGISTGQHLHFEFHIGLWNGSKSNAVNPLDYIPN